MDICTFFFVMCFFFFFCFNFPCKFTGVCTYDYKISNHPSLYFILFFSTSFCSRTRRYPSCAMICPWKMSCCSSTPVQPRKVRGTQTLPRRKLTFIHIPLHHCSLSWSDDVKQFYSRVQIKYKQLTISFNIKMKCSKMFRQLKKSLFFFKARFELIKNLKVMCKWKWKKLVPN